MQYGLLMIIPLLAFSSIEGATVLITGANRGIGLEFARQYKDLGYHVIGTARRPYEAKELHSLGVQVEQLDVANEASVKALAERLQGVPIDILINNAGIMRGRSNSLKTLNLDDMDASFAVNATGPLRVTQALLPNLQTGKMKKIVNITSNLGSIEGNSGGMYSYRVSKAALNQITKTLSIELKGQGFTVLALHPGWVKTDMGGKNATYTPKESINSMIKVIEKANVNTTGHFFDLHGNELPW